MNLLILEVKATSGYRGVYRGEPYHVDAVAEDHPVNRAFFDLADRFRPVSGFLDDLDFARHVVALYAACNPPQSSEIIEVTNGGEKPLAGGALLGFDLADQFNYSLLFYGLHFCEPPRVTAPTDDLRPLLCLIEKQFSPHLNANGLFGDEHIAQECLDCMLALQKFRPGLWEAEVSRFEVRGVWNVNAHNR